MRQWRHRAGGWIPCEQPSVDAALTSRGPQLLLDGRPASPESFNFTTDDSVWLVQCPVAEACAGGFCTEGYQGSSHCCVHVFASIHWSSINLSSCAQQDSC